MANTDFDLELDLTDDEKAALAEMDAELEDGVSDDAEKTAEEQAAAANDDDGANKEGDDAENGADGTDPSDKSGKDDDDAAASSQDDAEKGEGDNDTKQDDEKEAAETASKSPRPTFKAPEDLDEKLAEVEEKMDKLSEQFDDGEITAKQFNEQRRALTREERELSSQKIRAEVSKDIQNSSWEESCSAFLDEHPEFAPGSPLFASLNDTVKQLQKESGDSYNPDHLETARQKILAALNPTAKPENNNAGDTGDDPGGGDNKGGKNPGLGDPPPNLADIPAADIEDTRQGGEFAYLDRLAASDDIEGYEEALSKLPEEKRNAYMQSS